MTIGRRLEINAFWRLACENNWGRLFAYDLMIVWKGARSAFSKKRDVLFLLLAVPIVLLVAAQGASNAAMTVRDISEPGKMLLVSVTALFVEFAVDSRLAHLEAESIVARLALRSGPRLLHRLFWSAPPFVASISIMAAGSADSSPAPPRVAALILSYIIGAGAGALVRRGRRHVRRWQGRRRASAGGIRPLRLPGEKRRQRIAALVAARTGLAGPSVPANAVLFAAIGVVIALVYRLALGAVPRPGPELLAGVAATFAFGLLLRQHPPLLRYLLYLGIEPLRPALVPSVPACSLAAGIVLGAAVMNLAEALAFAALGIAAVLLFLVIASLRALHFATRSRQAAGLAMQVDALVILLAGFVAPPLAPAVLVARLLLLRRRARSLRYIIR